MIRSLIRKTREKLRDKGLRYMVFVSARRYVLSRLLLPFVLLWTRLFRKGNTFAFQGATYPYLYRAYNLSYRNERAVEVPVVWDIVQKQTSGRILEVGNVLSHYYPIRHTVLDKYEEAPGVLRQDVVDFRPAERYDLIVAVSTLEHVGWDWGEERDGGKCGRAIESLIAALGPGGRFVITAPVGFNPNLDRMIDEKKIPFKRLGCLKRVSLSNRWVEVPWEEARKARYDQPYNHANAIAIGIVE